MWAKRPNRFLFCARARKQAVHLEAARHESGVGQSFPIDKAILGASEGENKGSMVGAGVCLGGIDIHRAQYQFVRDE
jgi:hypothetical protein